MNSEELELLQMQLNKFYEPPENTKVSRKQSENGASLYIF